MLSTAKVLVACSGGLDSMVLATLCRMLPIAHGIAHCNFGLRGAESDEDEAFVKAYTAQWDIPFFHTRFDTETYANHQKLSIQMAARELRYTWFKHQAEAHQYSYVLTAHHADDALETFLINLSRGTGIDGLTGIPEVNDVYIRPLLPFSRATLEEFAKKHQLPWREDSSNKSTKYLRNQIRHEVVPILKKIQPQFLQHFQTTQRYLQQSNTLLKHTVAQIKKVAVQKEPGDIVRLDLGIIQAYEQPIIILYHLLKEYGFTAWEDIQSLCTAQAGKRIFSKTHRLLKDRECLYISPIVTAQKTAPTYTLSEEEEMLMIPGGCLKFEKVSEFGMQNTETIYVDKSQLKYPLCVRKRKEGDYLYPVGMKGKKKLSKYFKDEKLSLIAKENAWLLCSEDRIVWVVGYRADGRFKVTSATKEIIKISFHAEVNCTSNTTKS